MEPLASQAAFTVLALRMPGLLWARDCRVCPLCPLCKRISTELILLLLCHFMPGGMDYVRKMAGLLVCTQAMWAGWGAAHHLGTGCQGCRDWMGLPVGPVKLTVVDTPHSPPIWPAAQK